MVVIVGGGISGLTLAHELDRRGVDHVVLEATDRAGGVIRSGRVGSDLLEWGPQRGRLTADFARLIDELGLRGRVIEAPRGLPLFVHRDGRLRRVPVSARAFLSSDILPWRSRLRVLAEPLTAAARDDESVGALFRRKLGREAYESIAGPLYGGLYASDPDDMDVGIALRPALRELGVRRSLLVALLRRSRAATPAAFSFLDGLEELPRALLARHRAHIRLNTRVRAIRRRGSGWAIETDDAVLDASDVVFTSPADATATMLREAAPDAAARIDQLAYNPLAIVHVHADARLHGLGYQVSLAEPTVTRGVTFNEALFERRGVYTIFLGGAKNAWVADAPHERLARIALDEFREVTGHQASVLSVSHARMPAWDRSWRGVDGLELPAGLHVHANWHARPGLPGRLAGSRRLAARLG